MGQRAYIHPHDLDPGAPSIQTGSAEWVGFIAEANAALKFSVVGIGVGGLIHIRFEGGFLLCATFNLHLGWMP